MADKQTSDGSSDQWRKELYSCPAVRTPTIAQLKDIADGLGFHLDEDEMKMYHSFIEGSIESMNSTESIVEPTLPVKYPRLPGYRPEQEENPYNAWYWKCEIRGASSGKLRGKRIAMKDNVAVAGVPMMYGCHALEGYTPAFDATIVTRILDAGGIINGKAVCENFCFSGTSSTAAKGPVMNPHDKGRSTGGSSSGSAVVVSVGDADMAIGGDQGGSIRLPACWTGIVGLKPTHGLVPYTGAMSIEPCVDHLGPMTKTVYDCALMLEVIAGYDGGLDHRQHPHITVPEYTKELENADLSTLKIGLLTEGFNMPNFDPAVNSLITKTINKLKDVGVTVKDLSIPLHSKSAAIWALGCEGCSETIIRHGHVGTGLSGYYPTSFVIETGKMVASRPDDLSSAVKVYAMMGEYLKKNYKGQVYARGRNLAIKLRQIYDQALQEVDILALPTIPFTARELIHKDDTVTDYFKKCFEMTANTMAFNVTGHPAINVNAGFLEGLPVGVMLVGRHFDDVTVLKAAQAVEKFRDSSK